MFSGLATFLVGLFSSTKMQDTAIDAVRKLGNLDEMSHKEKAQFLLDYMKETKHQSPMRRLIAFMLSISYGLVLFIWIVASGVGFYTGNVASLEYAGAIKAFMESVLLQPFNILLSFYFVTNIASRIGK